MSLSFVGHQVMVTNGKGVGGRGRGASLFLLEGFLPGCILQQLCVHLICWQLHIADHRAPDEAVLDG